MKVTIKPIHLACLAALLPVVPLSAGITAVNGGTVEWNNAGWTAGVPGPGDAAFINDIAKVIIMTGEPAVAEGIRIGNVVPQMSVLQMEATALTVDFIVLGDAPNSNASYAQTGGKLTVRNTDPIDFELGNPFNSPDKASHSLASFAAGEAQLGDIRFNLRKNRKSRLVIFGILPGVSGDSLSFETAEEKKWNPGELTFFFSDAGVAPLKLSGPVKLGDKDRAVLDLNGTKYTGSDKEFVLIEAGSISGDFMEVKMDGFPKGSQVAIEGNRVLLRLP